VRYPFRRTLLGGVLAFFVLWVLSLGVIIVPAGVVGVVRFLGQVQPNVLNPGASWVVPFVNSVEEVDTRVQSHNFQQLTAATSENLQVTVTGTMNYRLDPQFAGVLIQEVGTDFASKIIDPAFSDYIKQVMPAYSADSNSPNFILNKRDEIRQLTRDQLGQNLAQYHILVNDIYIVDIGYPDEYNAAITAKQVEQQNVQREQQILEQRRIQAQQVVVTAQGAADALRETAAGQADANASINESLTDELIRWQAIQKLNPNVQIMLIPSDNNFILPLPSLQPVTPSPVP
jgi:regulator of protease activity HflC (stomatin/prohibitin superfamily)